MQSPSFVPARNIVPALGPSVSLRSRGGRASTICMSGAGGEPNLMNQVTFLLASAEHYGTDEHSTPFLDANIPIMPG